MLTVLLPEAIAGQDQQITQALRDIGFRNRVVRNGKLIAVIFEVAEAIERQLWD